MTYAKLIFKNSRKEIEKIVEYVKILKANKEDSKQYIKAKCIMCNDIDDIGKTYYYDKDSWKVIPLTKEQVFMEIL